MSLIEEINEDFQQALKNKEIAVISALRLLKSELTRKEKSARRDGEGKEITEEVALQVLKTQIKKIKESLETYQKAGREDLAEKEETELKILEKYLPQQLSAEELKKIIDKVINQLSEEKNFGQVMGLVMKEVAGRADGQLVSQLVKEKLGS